MTYPQVLLGQGLTSGNPTDQHNGDDTTVLLTTLHCLHIKSGLSGTATCPFHFADQPNLTLMSYRS